MKTLLTVFMTNRFSFADLLVIGWFMIAIDDHSWVVALVVFILGNFVLGFLRAWLRDKGVPDV